MPNILNFPTPKGRHNISKALMCDWDSKTKTITYMPYEEWMEKQAFRMADECLEYRKEIRAFKNMTIWQRIVFLITGY